jgi:hypothetical protein
VKRAIDFSSPIPQAIFQSIIFGQDLGFLSKGLHHIRVVLSRLLKAGIHH